MMSNLNNIINIDNNYATIDMANNLPPPPINRSVDIPIQPDFGFISSSLDKRMIETAYKVIAREEGWDIIRNFTGSSFMFANDDRIVDLMTKVNNEYGGGHSGASIGYTMRNIQYIANHGFESYRRNYLENQRVSHMTRPQLVRQEPIRPQQQSVNWTQPLLNQYNTQQHLPQ